jgi:hypothetical protein
MAQLKSTEDFLRSTGLAPVNAEDLQAKFDAVTKAEYDKQRTNLQNTENKFYDQLFDTQNTTMDTIRQSNAQAVATGASRGVQAANELSALLGLQQESVAGATDIANQATTLAQDETQAMLENALNAETQAQEANQALATVLMQRESVGVEQQNANTAEEQVKQQWQQLIEQVRQTNPNRAKELQAYYDAVYNTTGTADVDSVLTDAEQRQEDLKNEIADQVESAEEQEILTGLPAGNWGTGSYDTYDALIKYAQTEGSGNFSKAWNNSVQQGLAGLLNINADNIKVDTKTEYGHAQGSYVLTKISIPRSDMTDEQFNALKRAGSFRVREASGTVNIQIYAYKDAATNKKYGGNFTFSAVANALGG